MSFSVGGCVLTYADKAETQVAIEICSSQLLSANGKAHCIV